MFDVFGHHHLMIFDGLTKNVLKHDQFPLVLACPVEIPRAAGTIAVLNKTGRQASPKGTDCPLALCAFHGA